MSDEAATAETSGGAGEASIPTPSPVSDTSSSTDTSATEQVVDATPSSTPSMWNGELDSLQSSDWYTGLDESVRQQFEHGYGSKVKNLERGFTDKMTKLAEDRKAFESQRENNRSEQEGIARELDDAKQKLARFQRWLGSGVSPSEELTAELKTARDSLTALQSQLEQSNAEREKSLEAARTSWKTESDERYAALQGKYDDLNKEHEAFVRQSDEAILGSLETWIDKEAPDLYSNDDAMNLFGALLQGGITEDPAEALTMVASKYPAFRKVKPKQLPPALDAMAGSSSVGFSPGKSNGASGNPLADYNRLKNQLFRR